MAINEKFPVEYNDIRKQIVDLLEEKFKTENPDVYESGFLAFFVDSIATGVVDSLLYSSLAYKEAFLDHAILPESILAIASQLSYKVANATPSEVDILISIPYMINGQRLWDHIKFIIDADSEFHASNIVYTLPYKVVFDFDYTNPTTIINDLYKEEDNNITKIPFLIDTIQPDPTKPDTESYIQFYVTCKQYVKRRHDLTAPNIVPLQFSTVELPFSDQVYKTDVYVKNTDTGVYELWEHVDNVFQLTYGQKGYATSIFEERIVFTFGNGIYGRLPLPGSSIIIYIYETKGKNGKIVSGSITGGPKVYNEALNSSGGIVNMYLDNPAVSTDGSDRETLEQIRKNAKDFARAVNGLVSEKNYSNLAAILDMPLQNAKAIIKRSDIHSNEIFTYIVSKYDDDSYVPTRSDKVIITNGQVNNPITIDGYDFVCPYIISLDTVRASLHYLYTLKDYADTVKLIGTTDDAKNYLAVILSYRLLWHENTRTWDLYVYYDYHALDQNGNDDLNFAANLVVDASVNYHSYNLTNYANGKYFKGTINYSDVPEGLTDIILTLKFNDSGTIKTLKTYKATVTMIQNLDQLISSPAKLINQSNNIWEAYDVPLFEKKFYDRNKQWLDINILQKLANFTKEVTNYRMMTDQVYLKFANTIGNLRNIYFNARNNSAVKTYPPTPKFNLPIEINLNVYIEQKNKQKADLVILNVKDAVYNEMKDSFTYERNIYLSEITKIVQKLDFVEFCEVTSPWDSVVYDYNIEDLTKQEMIEYVPEFIWFNKDNIVVNIIID